MMRAGVLFSVVVLAVGCGPTQRHGGGDDADVTIDTSKPGPDVNSCPDACSSDTHAVLDCHGNVKETCQPTQACETATTTCTDACTAANTNHRSIGCDYYATDMESYSPSYCFAAFVANTWTSPAHIKVSYKGVDLPVANFVRLPIGSGPSLSYGAYDAQAGLAAGQVAVLFLTGSMGSAPNCPVTPANAPAEITGTGTADSFHITTDVPVVAYQINPYGGGSVAVTAGSLLIPTSAWDTDYIAVNVTPTAIGNPSLNMIASEDGTQIKFTPVAAVSPGNGVPGGSAGQPMMINLNKGQQVQITQGAELTGSAISANKPIGFMAGQPCMQMPIGTPYCDHGEQMIPPVRALGHKYAGAMYRPRVSNETQTYWRIVGAVDGTTLAYSASVGGPATLNKGQAVTFATGTPFTVESQDKDHPFMLFEYMTGSNAVQDGYGDPDFVYIVPPEQYLSQYVFFTDPTYPETNLVVIRAKGSDNAFHDVQLDCMTGPLTGWQPIGLDYEYTRTDLSTGNFTNVGNCSNGRHDIQSAAPFGLTVWGWGTPITSSFTENVSYGYPGGMNVTPINDVIIP